MQKAVSKRLSLDTESNVGSPEPEELSAFNIEDDIQMRVHTHLGRSISKPGQDVRLFPSWADLLVSALHRW